MIDRRNGILFFLYIEHHRHQVLHRDDAALVRHPDFHRALGEIGETLFRCVPWVVEPGQHQLAKITQPAPARVLPDGVL
jgi:hypothetical protein